MKLSIKPFEYLPCSAETFYINGIRAELSEFGEVCGCGNVKFKVTKTYNDYLSDKYYISEKDFNDICQKLREVFSFSDCYCCE